MTVAPGDCECLATGPGFPEIAETRSIGTDPTSGRFACVALNRCNLCSRLWLHYEVEYEAFSGSGRWATCPISEDAAATMTPEQAADFIVAQPWHIYGGSYWGHAGVRGEGALPWGP